MHYKLFFSALFLALFTGIFQAEAQKTSPPREVGLQTGGINFDGFNAFSIFLKKQKKEHVYNRLRLFYGNINTAVLNDNYNFSFGGGIAIGRERRKSLDSKLSFYQGPEVTAALGFSSIGGGHNAASATAGFNWVLGLQHQFNEFWAVNIEATPGVSCNVNSAAGRHNRYSLNANLSSTVYLGLVRMF